MDDIDYCPFNVGADLASMVPEGPRFAVYALNSASLIGEEGVPVRFRCGVHLYVQQGSTIQDAVVVVLVAQNMHRVPEYWHFSDKGVDRAYNIKLWSVGVDVAKGIKCPS
jgi:hypothetical protein